MVKKRMGRDTPAKEIRTKDLDANREALRELLQAFPLRSPKEVLDVRYGLGGWARVVADYFPGARIVGYEQDQETAEAAWKNRWVNLRVQPFDPEAAGHFSLVLADFNTLTVLKREELDALLPPQPKSIIFTDVACSKLHLNYYAYKLAEPDLDEYWRRFVVRGYRFVAYRRRHHAASTALYVRKDLL